VECPATWCRILSVDAGGVVLAAWIVSAAERPDLGHVELVARLKLAAGRAGAAVVCEISPGLSALLELTGLGQMRGEPEEREERRGVEEGVVGGDPPV
jgi:hypothetical protein